MTDSAEDRSHVAARGRARELARFLRQREELASGSILFETMDRTEAARLVKAGLAMRRADGPDAIRGETSGAARPPGIRRAEESRETAKASTAADVDPGASSVDPDDLPSNHDELRTLALDCTLCGLSKDRTQVVFHDGAPEARLMVVGEAPGANEDRTGVPFVGAAGKFLDLLMATVGLSREESVYICNVIKCRPPGNRNPKPDEISACSPYLKRQIELVRPEVILAVGTFSAQLLTGKDIALGKLRGEIYSYEGIPLVATYHPAALLRNSRWIRPTWEDFQLLRQVMDPSD